MPKSASKAPSGSTPASQEIADSKTPVGVWVIVGLAVFFMIGGLGVSALVIWKSVGSKTAIPEAEEVHGEKAAAVPSIPAAPDGEVGIDRPSPNSPVLEAKVLVPVVSDRVEEDRVKQEVLQRIDLMRALNDAEKDKLYALVERARGFRKIAIIPFTQTRTNAGAAQIDGLIKTLNGPDLRKLLADPTVALIMVGYVDKKGDEEKNLEISRTRAENVVKAVREKMDLVNVMHAVGMGGQDIDQADPEKNRAVEVWAVQP
jgi:hypothetical protein